MKADEGLIIENPMYEMAPVDTKNVDEVAASESLPPKDGTGTLTSELGVTSTDD